MWRSEAGVKTARHFHLCVAREELFSGRNMSVHRERTPCVSSEGYMESAAEILSRSFFTDEQEAHPRSCCFCGPHTFTFMDEQIGRLVPACGEWTQTTCYRFGRLQACIRVLPSLLRIVSAVMKPNLPAGAPSTVVDATAKSSAGIERALRAADQLC